MDELGKSARIETQSCFSNFKNLIAEQKTQSIYLEISKEKEMYPALATCKTLMHFLNYDTCKSF